MENAISKDQNEQINRITKIDQSKNSFKSIVNAEEFFKQLGFGVQIHSFLEVKDQLYLPRKLGISDKEIGKILKPWVVFVMKVK
jgi:hypothetical protein